MEFGYHVVFALYYGSGYCVVLMSFTTTTVTKLQSLIYLGSAIWIFCVVEAY